MTIELPIVSCVSALLVLVPLPWHWKTRNVCTTSAILWLAACNIIRTINTVAWLDNVTVKYEIWCDIISRVEISANIGVPAATMAPKPSEKRQRAKFEIGMCVGLPLILTSLHIIVESCRFVITKGLGCSMCYYPSIPALLITQIPAIMLSWAALIYSGVTLRWLIHRRVQFRLTHIAPLTPTSSRYLRLVAMAITQMTFASVMSLFLMTIEMNTGLNSWTSWEDVHQDWREVIVQSRDSMSEMYWVVATVAWYFVPIASITTFGYFAFDDRIVADYKHTFACIKTRIPGIKSEAIALSFSSANQAISSQTRSDTNNIVIDIGNGLGLEENRPAENFSSL